MKRLVIRWVAMAVFLVALALVFVRLGEWQLDRLDQRRDANDTVVANQDEAVVDYRQLMGEPVAEELQWRRVEVTGRYTGEQFLVRYRNQDKAAGSEVVAVLQTDQHRLLVDRGFIPRPQGEPEATTAPAPPEGTVTITGHLRRDERGDDVATTPHEGMVRLINSDALGEAIDVDLLPGYVSLISSDPPDGADLQPITPPPLTEGNHFSYALQWFAFGIIAVVGIGVLIRTDIKDRQRARERAERRRQRAVAEAAAALEVTGLEGPDDDTLAQHRAGH